MEEKQKAFLKELQELLKKYDANISYNHYKSDNNIFGSYYDISMKNTEVITVEGFCINSDNIFPMK